MNYNQLHSEYKEQSLLGRYITLDNIEPILSQIQTEIIGYSVLEKPIYKYTVGNGKTKVFMWSQMHGNESTTTKALFDFFNLIHSKNPIGVKLLEEFTFCFLPMVNPDGAKMYTRENANEVDLNRDAKNLSQPESKALRATFELFKPDFCYNLHDQRTIYGVADTGKPATVSFLAPSFNANREVNKSRLKAMNVIVAMNEELQKHIPNQVARFDDGFNDNCIGDTFQMLGIPTILFEAGHFQDDYDREITRKLIFIAFISGLKAIYENDIVDNKFDNYMNILQNKPNFFDYIYKNIKINYDKSKLITSFAIQYKEVLVDQKILFEAQIDQIGNLENYFGHITFDAKGKKYYDIENNIPYIGQKANFCIGKRLKIINGQPN
jgi:hypothetical protein